MRLHSDILTAPDILAAIVAADCTLGGMTPHRSRSRSGSFDVFAHGHGKNGGQWGTGDGKTASWDDWGMILAALYRIDPRLVVGSSAQRATYRDAAHFSGVTKGRYWALTPDQAHHSHKWQRDPNPGESWTGSYIDFRCPRCGAGLASIRHGGVDSFTDPILPDEVDQWRRELAELSA